MPRISPVHLRRARSLNKLLPPLLPICRDLGSARSELQWLEEHAKETSPNPVDARKKLLGHVRRRSRHEPLQYLLKSEFFGNLEIKCRPGVLIPRQETALSITRLVLLLSRQFEQSSTADKLRVLDLCTGTGCIPLLFHHEFYKSGVNKSTELDLIGVDISPIALRLAHENQQIQIGHDSGDVANRSQSLGELAFLQADVLIDASSRSRTGILDLNGKLREWIGSKKLPKVDILISNPPYIAESSFRRTASRSVRHHEPKIALVPPQTPQRIDSFERTSVEDGDAFYPRLFDIADELNVQVVLFEVGDINQAIRVARMAFSKASWDYIEIWRDEPDKMQTEEININGTSIVVRGMGHGRSVFACRGKFQTLRSGLNAHESSRTY